MDILIEAGQALLLIVLMAAGVFLVPLLFMFVFSLATGFDERVPIEDDDDE